MIEVTIKLLDTDEFGGLFKWFSRSEWAWMIDKSINYRKWMSMKYSLNLIVDEPKMWNLSSLKCHSSKMNRSKCDEIGFYYLLGVMWSKSILYIDRESLRSTMIQWSHDHVQNPMIPWSIACTKLCTSTCNSWFMCLHDSWTHPSLPPHIFTFM